MVTTQDAPVKRTFQFDVQSLVWLMVTIGFCLSFLRSFGIEIVVEGIAVIASAALLGLVIGLPRRRAADVVYWSILGAIVAFMSVVGAFLPHWSARYAWVVAGALSGAMIGSVSEDRRLVTIVVGTIAATIIIGLHAAFLYSKTGQVLAFDVICAALAGMIFGSIVVVFRWFEERNILRRDSSATILMLLVVIANYVDRYLAL
jgi:hypothetical protein